MTTYISNGIYIDKCDSCYSPEAVQIAKTIHNTVAGDSVKICIYCLAEEEE